MRLVLGAAFAAALIATPAAAQTATLAPSQCPALSEAPAIPDGATAEPAAMQSANQAYVAWSTSFREALQCRRGEVEQLQAALQARIDEHNAAAARLNEVNTSWAAEAEEFNARTQRRSTTR